MRSPWKSDAITALSEPRVIGFYWHPTPRHLPGPWYLYASLVLWAAWVGLIQWIGVWTGTPLIVYSLRRLTGIPCPTCGGTRMVMALLNGHLWDALLFNPLLFIALGGLATWLLIRMCTGYSLYLAPNAVGIALLIGLGGLLILGNWGYLIATDYGLAWRYGR